MSTAVGTVEALPANALSDVVGGAAQTLVAAVIGASILLEDNSAVACLLLTDQIALAVAEAQRTSAHNAPSAIVLKTACAARRAILILLASGNSRAVDTSVLNITRGAAHAHTAIAHAVIAALLAGGIDGASGASSARRGSFNNHTADIIGFARAGGTVANACGAGTVNRAGLGDLLALASELEAVGVDFASANPTRRRRGNL